MTVAADAPLGPLTPAPYDGPEYVGDEQDEPELVDEEYGDDPGR